MWTETFPSLNEDKNNVQPHRENRTVRICPVLEGEEMLQALRANRTAEAQRGKTDTDPGELVGDTDDVLQPGPQFARADVARAEAEAADDRGG